MKKLSLIATIVALSLSALQAAETRIGYVNFKKCVEKSKQGQQEKNAFEALKKQMSSTLEKTDKELEEMAKKLQDQDYMDGLSPTAENDLKQKFQTLSQEFSRYQNQYYQLLNQANYKMLQNLHEEVSDVAEAVRKKHDLSLILGEDSTFAYSPSLDFTEEVVMEMDTRFEKENNTR